MKFSIHLSNTGLMVIMALVLGALLITDINAHHTSSPYAPTLSTSGVTDRVVTKEFVLVDDQGQTRARIGMNDKGSPAMQLFDRKGQQRAQLRLNGDDVPSLRLYDANGTLRSAMSFNLGTLEPGFVLFDENGVGSWLNAMDSSGWLNPADSAVLNSNGMLGPVYDEDAPHPHLDASRPFLWAGPDRETMKVAPKDGFLNLQFQSDANR